MNPLRAINPTERAQIRQAEKNIKKKVYVYSSERFTNRFLQEVLPDGSWRGKECFVVGGGPSLRDFDWQLLKGRRVIGVNRVYERFDPTIIFSMDTRFLRWTLNGQYGDLAKHRFMNSQAYKVWLCTYVCSLPEDIFIVGVWQNYSQGLRAFSASMKDGIGHGNNSGYAALNLAACLGASPIYLVGFDMRTEGEKTHWHRGHPNPMRSAVLENFLKYFNLAAPRIRRSGIEVVNLNPDSALDCFPKRRLEEVLN